MAIIRGFYKVIRLDLIVYWFYGLFVIKFTLIYLKYPEKLKNEIFSLSVEKHHILPVTKMLGA